MDHKKKLKLYLDSCVYNRPFDYQGQNRVSIETDIFLYILEKIESNFYELITSDVLVFENSRNPYYDRKDKIFSYFVLSKKFIKIERTDHKRAEFLNNLGFSSIDALHIALAEKAAASYFITCDKGIIKTYKKHKELIKTEIVSLIEFLEREK